MKDSKKTEVEVKYAFEFEGYTYVSILVQNGISVYIKVGHTRPWIIDRETIKKAYYKHEEVDESNM